MGHFLHASSSNVKYTHFYMYQTRGIGSRDKTGSKPPRGSLAGWAFCMNAPIWIWSGSDSHWKPSVNTPLIWIRIWFNGHDTVSLPLGITHLFCPIGIRSFLQQPLYGRNIFHQTGNAQWGDLCFLKKPVYRICHYPYRNSILKQSTSCSEKH